MKSFRIFPTIALFIWVLFSPSVFAVIDNNAPIVKLRTTCQDGSNTLDNCFTSTHDLTTWINTIRISSDASPLLVEIGPGSFSVFICSQAGITLRGAGPQRTKLGYDSIYGISGRAGCNNLNVESLTAEGGLGGNGVIWVGGGDSTWTNVTLKGVSFGWTGDGTGCGVHRWRSSLIIGSGTSTAKGYHDRCGEHWFLGTEIAADAGNGATRDITGVVAEGGEYHVYGSNIRATGSVTVASQPGDPTKVIAVYVTGGSKVHIHGTGVDAIGKGPYDVAGIWADSGVEVHANESSYNLQAVAGQTRYRLKDDGALHLHAPYLWEQHATPPADVTSVNGADLAVVTDGTQPHLLVYSSSCASKWFDTSTNACRP